MQLTRDLAWAAATDAGNRAMRQAERKGWSESDYQVACQEFERLWPEKYDIRGSQFYKQT